MEISHWRLKQQRYKLVGEICPHCKAKIFPPRPTHQGCSDKPKEIDVTLDVTNGTIFSSKSPLYTSDNYTEAL